MNHSQISANKEPVLCLMAGSSDPSNDSKRSFSKVKDDIYFFKRDELLNCLETTIDQCMKVGATYRESKR